MKATITITQEVIKDVMGTVIGFRPAEFTVTNEPIQSTGEPILKPPKGE